MENNNNSNSINKTTGTITQKRNLETKQQQRLQNQSTRKKVVFVDPDDPAAPHWWPAIVVPRAEITQFKQRMDYDVRYPEEGTDLVCYFEDASFSIVPEKDQKPFDTSLPPYTTYLRGLNAGTFQNDKAMANYSLEGGTGNTVKFTEASVADFSMDDESNNVKSSTTSTTSSMKRHRRKGGISSNVQNRRDSKDKIHGSINVDSITNNSIGGSSSTIASSDSTVKNALNIKKENNNESTSSQGKKLTTSNNNNTVDSSSPTQIQKTSNTDNNDNNNITRAGVETLPPPLPTTASSSTPIEISLLPPTERTTTTTTLSSSRTNKLCAHCGDNARDGGGADTRLLCINCNGMVNALLSDGSLNSEDVYWQHLVTRKRKYSCRLWDETGENLVKINVLDGMIPKTKRQRWIKRFENY
ncbi:4294_t:CDS:2 [Ambispora gerdemannii]|uniref:4294_t:CDS:1 n=1 Tax=Ambispora gerdemannii TaxID=144530 RepID=A0A9N9GQQ3_9GLOM|nr:4294_t:CDS:2 [Ambispora gerdemannii]